MDVASITHNDVISPELDAGWLSPTLPGSELPIPKQGARAGCSSEAWEKDWGMAQDSVCAWYM